MNIIACREYITSFLNVLPKQTLYCNNLKCTLPFRVVFKLVGYEAIEWTLVLIKMLKNNVFLLF